MARRALGGAILLLLTLGACVGPSPAEVATYQAIGPDYLRYVEQDVSLSGMRKQDKRDLVESWRLRVGVSK